MVVAVFAGTLLPYLSQRDRRLLAEDEDEDVDSEIKRIREMVRQWKAESARNGQPIKLPTMPFMLRNIWTAGTLFGADGSSLILKCTPHSFESLCGRYGFNIFYSNCATGAYHSISNKIPANFCLFF